MRKRSPKSKGFFKNPNAAAALKAAWKDPVKREKMLSKPGRKAGKRTGVPDGMRRAQVEPLWAKAREYSEKFIKMLEDNDQIEKTPKSGSEEEMAKAALKEAFTIAVGPMTDAKTKVPALRLVLEYTKAKPEQKTKLTLDNAEAWLSAVEEDMKKE